MTAPEPRQYAETRAPSHAALWEFAKRMEAENIRLRAALRQAYHCCARPSGVCFDPSVIDGTPE